MSKEGCQWVESTVATVIVYRLVLDLTYPIIVVLTQPVEYCVEEPVGLYVSNVVDIANY
jgi:hypothetical protein